jgi:hypothetical protein
MVVDMDDTDTMTIEHMVIIRKSIMKKNIMMITDTERKMIMGTGRKMTTDMTITIITNIL